MVSNISRQFYFGVFSYIVRQAQTTNAGCGTSSEYSKKLTAFIVHYITSSIIHFPENYRQTIKSRVQAPPPTPLHVKNNTW